MAVFLADGVDEIGKDQRPFQEVYLSKEFHLVDGKEVPGQHEERQGVGREKALVSDVMDREQRSRVAKQRIARITGAQQGDPQDFRRLQHRS